MSGHHHHPSTGSGRSGDGTGRALLITVAVNLSLTAAKWLAFAVTGSPSLFGEAAHSTADSMNPIVLWIGRRRGRRPVDARHPLGHGRETFFWSLIASLMMLFIGSFLTAWRGIVTLVSGHRPEYSPIALAILGCALAGESWSFFRSWKELKGNGGAVRRLRESRDSVLLGIIFENGADVLTVILALAGFGLYALTGDARWDGAFSLMIAALLAVSSLFLINRNRSLLIGESAPSDIIPKIAAAVCGRASVGELVAVCAVMASPDHVSCKVTVRWNADWFTGRWFSMPDATSFHPKKADWLLSLVTSEVETVKASVLRSVPDVSSVEIVIVE
jgi:cation diffusion facilitator family transporter